MQEIWKDIKNYPKYQVSNLGRVKSLNYMRTNREKVLSLKTTRCGYLTFLLYKNGKRKNALVHRVVAEAFLPNLDNKPQVNHMNGDKTNNRVDNLEWATQSENEKHAFRTGLKHKPINKYNILQYDTRGNLIKVWDSAREIKDNLGISKTQIGLCANGKQCTSHGFIWRYKEAINYGD